MKFLLGTKNGMTQIYEDDGKAVPVTVLEVQPSTVVQLKSPERDGYSAVQLGYGERKAKNISRAQLGHMRDLGHFRYLREFRLSESKLSELKPGQQLDASVFEPGDEVMVSGLSKGKGFQGVVKRHGFAGGPRSHGQKHSEREPGSIGATGPQRVMKGKKMAGRMGNRRVSTLNLKVIRSFPDQGLVLLKGAVPGRVGTLLEVKTRN